MKKYPLHISALAELRELGKIDYGSEILWTEFENVYTNTNLDSEIALFDANGKPIKSWEIDSTYDTRGTGISFLDKNEKFTAINGTFIIEEK